MTLTESIELSIPTSTQTLKPIAPTKPQHIQLVSDSLISDIHTFKEDTIAWAKEALANDKDRNLLEIKEVKDLIAIVTQVENSLIVKDPDAGKPTINVFIQNMIDGVKDDI